tara:strand:- start:1368 stop:1847 length:480 start_codon:yes stop_codon:yes gene_type:complete
MNTTYNYKCVDKTNPTYKNDKTFGTQNEIKFLNYLNTELYPNDKFSMFKNQHSTMDFINSKIIAELKSRRNKYDAYPDTMVGQNKIEQAEASYKLNKDKKYKFYFLFTDGLFEWDFKPEQYSTRLGGRNDRGSNEIKKYSYIDIHYLNFITDDINSNIY